MKSYFLVTLMFLFSPAVRSETTLIISDIDDTLKMTNVRASLSTMMSYALKTGGQSFYGMAAVLNSLTCKNLTNADCKNPNVERTTRYVTAAQGFLSSFGKATLREDGFPDGDVYSRGYFEDKFTFKQSTIIKLYLQEKPDVMVLMGDNAELDAAVYAGIEEKLAELGHTPMIYTYIHMIHPVIGNDDRLFRGQQAYITAIDLAAVLVSDGLLPAAEFDRIFIEVWPHWNTSSSRIYKRIFPDYILCKDWFAEHGEALYSYNLGNSVFNDESWTSYVEDLGLRCEEATNMRLIAQAYVGQ